MVIAPIFVGLVIELVSH
nr:type I toxin-antitoxin system Fst family toxin [Enterococcus hirae]